MSRVINFSAGPAALPLPALERAREELLDFAGTGMSVMEQSHRGKDYESVHNEAIALLRELTGLPRSHEVLFVQGGASQQFAQVPMNLLSPGASADYVVNGVWGEKALGEATVTAKLLGSRVRLAASTAEATGAGKAQSYRRVPHLDEIQADPSAAYLHVTSNETIHGVQFGADEGAPFPDGGDVPLVCDMSSDFLWRPVDYSRFKFVYAGAQKNVGPSGVVIVLADKEFIARSRRDIPKIFRYDVIAENNSLYNTPPTFGIYLTRNVLEWLKGEGGLAAIEMRNREKARLVYDLLDKLPQFYRCPVERASRSLMNIVFRLPSEELEAAFVGEAKAAGMVGLKGHRSVGGIRVSLYNAVDVASAKTLASFMEEFARTRG